MNQAETILTNLPQEQRWRGQAFPSAAVVAIVQRQKEGHKPSQFLLIKRNGEPYAGRWALVGGKWEFGETMADAITREVKEETALDAKFISLRGLVSERVIPHSSGEKGAHFLILVCELTAVGEATEQYEGAVAWFTLAEIETLHNNELIIPSDYQMIRSFAVETTETAPYYEAEMQTLMGAQKGQPVQLLRFERIDNNRKS